MSKTMRATAVPEAPIETLSFGCRLNLVETEAMRRVAGAQGCGDVVIVNSCAVTAEASRQTRQAIRRMKRQRPGARIVVTGCGAEAEPELYRAMPEVGALIANRNKTEAETWARLRRAVDRGVASSAPGPIDLSGAEDESSKLSAVAGTQDHTRAFLAVQNGCDHACTFCIIPAGRGASRSVPIEEACAKARELAEQGFGEIVLTGVDLTSYGADLPGVPRLGDLIRQMLHAAPTLPRLRLSSIDCIEADPVLLRCFAEEARLMPSLHLSLQSGSDLILKRMRRRHGRKEAIAFCAELRRLRPDIVFGADLIAGFPTETEEDFHETRALIEECGLTYLHIFPFSARPGTPAARMPPLAPAIIKERARLLREEGAARLAHHLAGRIGQRLRLLTERGGFARAEDFSLMRLPDVPPGLFVEAMVEGSDGEILVGQRL